MNKKLMIVIIFFIAIILIGLLFFFYQDKNKEDEAAAIKLYSTFMEEALKNYHIEDFQYLSIDINQMYDPLSGKHLNDSAKQEILNIAKKYNITIYDKPKAELESRSEKGLCLKINLVSTKGRKAKIYVAMDVCNGNENPRSSQYDIQYKDHSWQYEETSVTITAK